LQFNSESEYDYDQIYQLSSVETNCTAIATYNNNCYYAKNGILYNLITGFSKSFNGLNIFCIDYSNENNCIALGTDAGLYIINPNDFKTIYIAQDLRDNDSNIKHIS
jgi:hypothetical protein